MLFFELLFALLIFFPTLFSEQIFSQLFLSFYAFCPFPKWESSKLLTHHWLEPKGRKHKELIVFDYLIELHDVDLVSASCPCNLDCSCVVSQENFVSVSELQQESKNVKFWNDVIAVLIEHAEYKWDYFLSGK